MSKLMVIGTLLATFVVPAASAAAAPTPTMQATTTTTKPVATPTPTVAPTPTSASTPASAPTLSVAADATATVPAASATSAVVDPDEVTVDLITVNGSGCPLGTAAAAPSPDGKAFTVTYSEYVAQTRPGLASAQNNCQINMRVNAPAGFTYAIVKSDYRGFGAILPGARAELLGLYYFQGDSLTSYIAHELPVGEGDWQVTDEVPMNAVVHAPCGEKRNLNINTRLKMYQGTSTEENYVSMDSTDVSYSTMYHFNWMQCPTA